MARPAGQASCPPDNQAAGYDVGTPRSPVAPIPNTTASSGRNALATIQLATQQTVQQGVADLSLGQHGKHRGRTR